MLWLTDWRTLSYAERDAADGVRRDFGICFLPADPEDHRGVGGDGGGGVQGFTQPALRSALVHFNGYLQSRTERSKQVIQIIQVIKWACLRGAVPGYSGLLLESWPWLRPPDLWPEISRQSWLSLLTSTRTSCCLVCGLVDWRSSIKLLFLACWERDWV